MSTNSQSESYSNLRKYPQILQAAETSDKTRESLDNILTAEVGNYTSEDASLVVFGSLARDEWTSGSDLDWTYLVDGQADPAHLLIRQRIDFAIEKQKGKFKPPGQTGTFGNMAFSHDMVHQIGGLHDTNRNMTQRILLLLESKAIGKRPMLMSK